MMQRVQAMVTRYDREYPFGPRIVPKVDLMGVHGQVVVGPVRSSFDAGTRSTWMVLGRTGCSALSKIHRSQGQLVVEVVNDAQRR